MQFRSVLEGKTGKEIPESSRLEFLEKFLANNFALSDAEDNTYGPLNRGGTADLPLLRTLLAIRQKSREPRFICKFGSFKNPALALKLIELFISNACVRYFLFFSPNFSPLKTMKNAFYFIYKALFVEIFTFLHFSPPLFFSLSVIALQDDRN